MYICNVYTYIHTYIRSNYQEPCILRRGTHALMSAYTAVHRKNKETKKANNQSIYPSIAVQVPVFREFEDLHQVCGIFHYIMCDQYTAHDVNIYEYDNIRVFVNRYEGALVPQTRVLPRSRTSEGPAVYVLCLLGPVCSCADRTHRKPCEQQHGRNGRIYDNDGIYA